MTIHLGALVGSVLAAAGARQVPNVFQNSTDQIIVRDRVELSAAPANDLILLARLPSATVLDPDGCICWFDDLGTGITLDVGEGTTHIDALVDGQDVATAAGSFNLLKTVDIANYFEPIWKQLGYAKDPNKPIELFAKILGGAATGTVVWQLKGAKR